MTMTDFQPESITSAKQRFRAALGEVHPMDAEVAAPPACVFDVADDMRRTGFRLIVIAREDAQRRLWLCVNGRRAIGEPSTEWGEQAVARSFVRALSGTDGNPAHSRTLADGTVELMYLVEAA